MFQRLRDSGARGQGVAARIPPVVHGLKTGVLSAVFWSAIVLPAIYLPLLIVGLETTQTALLFVGLVGLHLLTVICGHSYRRSADS